MVQGGEDIPTGSGTISICFERFQVVWSSVCASEQIGYSSLEPLASLSVSSSYSRAVSFQSMTFLDGVADDPLRLEFDLGVMVLQSKY